MARLIGGSGEGPFVIVCNEKYMKVNESGSTPNLVGRDAEEDGSVFRVRKSGKEFTIYWDDEDSMHIAAAADGESITVSEGAPLTFKLSYYKSISDWQVQPCHVEVTSSPKSYLGYDEDEELFKIYNDVDIKKTDRKKWLQFKVKKLPVDKDGKVSRAPKKTRRKVAETQNVKTDQK